VAARSNIRTIVRKVEPDPRARCFRHGRTRTHPGRIAALCPVIFGGRRGIGAWRPPSLILARAGSVRRGFAHLVATRTPRVRGFDQALGDATRGRPSFRLVLRDGVQAGASRPHRRCLSTAALGELRSADRSVRAWSAFE
jgi:hypothetical protein